jgi:hypothetical protein
MATEEWVSRFMSSASVVFLLVAALLSSLLVLLSLNSPSRLIKRGRPLLQTPTSFALVQVARMDSSFVLTSHL